ncbi:MAG: hypothetical protein LCH96_04970 [Actinobacteria bacterium]|nr:hypothetical protein [Actinomycetota bacterium]
MSVRWHAALGYALTGAELALPETGRPDAAALIGELADAGWPAERIARHAREVADAELGWPHQVPLALREGCGAAQFAAVLGATRALLELTTLETRPPSARRTLDRDEERLMREKPPHHGS